MKWKSALSGVAGVAVLAAASFCLGALIRATGAGPTPQAAFAEAASTAAQAVEPPTAAADAVAMIVSGSEVGVVRVSGQPVFQLASKTGGLTPFERANIVASRINALIHTGVNPREIQAAVVRGEAVVRDRDVIVVTADPLEAQRQQMTTVALADKWADALSSALIKIIPPPATPSVAVRGRTPSNTVNPRAGGTSGTAVREWHSEEPYSDKWVPILSVLEGIKVGVARVSGPQSRVHLVQAVAQLETHFKDYIQIEIYVPISTEVPGKKLDRVQGCAVTGLGDIKL